SRASAGPAPSGAQWNGARRPVERRRRPGGCRRPDRACRRLAHGHHPVVDARRRGHRQHRRRHARRHGGYQEVVSARALSSKRPGRVERVSSARLRVVSMLAVAIVLAGMVWSRLAYWQVAQHGMLTTAAQAQYHDYASLPALRGAIFDRNMTQLVVNTTVYSAFVSPDQITAGERDRV